MRAFGEDSSSVQCCCEVFNVWHWVAVGDGGIKHPGSSRSSASPGVLLGTMCNGHAHGLENQYMIPSLQQGNMSELA